MEKKNATISTTTILRIIFILLAFGFAYLIRGVLALFFIAAIISASFDPWIDWLQRKKIPRALGIIAVYLLFFTIIGGSLFLLSGSIINEIKEMSRSFPELYDRLVVSWQKINGMEAFDKYVTAQNVSNTLGSSLGNITKGLTIATTSIFGALTAIFGGIVGFFIVLVLAFYLTAEEQGLKTFAASLVPQEKKALAVKLIGNIQTRIGYWLRGQLILSIIIFLMVYATLSILGVKYALILALIAGIFEIVPFLGPVISAVPAVFFAFNHGFGSAVTVAIAYFVIQQIENHLIVPKVMNRSTGLSPLVVIMSILIGARLAGAIGGLLAVPVALVISVTIETLRAEKNK